MIDLFVYRLTFHFSRQKLNEPPKITSGFYYKWTESLSDYKANAGYTLKYVFYNANNNLPITSTANANGIDHDVILTAGESEHFEAGTYAWKSYVEHTSGERYPIASGTIIIEQNILQSSPSDFRSHARKTLEAIEAALERRATKEQLSISIAGRALQYMTIKELLEARSVYQQEVDGEIAKEKMDAGLKPGGRVLLQFE